MGSEGVEDQIRHRPTLVGLTSRNGCLKAWIESRGTRDRDCDLHTNWNLFNLNGNEPKFREKALYLKPVNRLSLLWLAVNQTYH